MKILVVAVRLCYPLDGGAKIRAYYLLRALAQRHDVTMLTYYGDKSEQKYFSHFKEMGVTLLPIYSPAVDGGITMAAARRALSSGLPFNVAKYYSRAMEDAIVEQLQGGFDCIHCEHLHMFSMIPHTECPVILDAHNVESQIADRYAAAQFNPLKKALFAWNGRRMKYYETNAVRSSRQVLAVSREDMDTFRSFGANENVKVLENGVDLEFFKPSDDHSVGESIAFVGSMDWRPNSDGIEYFLNDILPLIRIKHSNVTVSIVGKNPSANLIDRVMTKETGVVVTGTVPDVRPFVEQATVCIVPLKVGGGTRLKVLEGFAMGKAVVSTSLGCEGIECVHGQQILIVDDAPEFARAVVELLEKSDLREILGQNARQLAEQKYSWDALGTKLLEYYDEIATR